MTDTEKLALAIDTLVEVRDRAQKNMDVVDGEHGPRSDDRMQIYSAADAALARIAPELADNRDVR